MAAKQAELEAAIAQLQEQLEAAHRREEHLRQRVVDLEDTLEAEQATVVQLKTELRQASQLRAELEEARQTILKLSEAASSATQQVTTLKRELSEAIAQETDPASPMPTPQPIPPEPQIKPGLTLRQQELKRILSHPVPPESPNTALSDDDLGWVD
jgi:chromosome segregation ATPase